MEREKLEAALVGGIVRDAESRVEVKQILATLQPENFSNSMLRKVYEACRSLYLEQKPIDEITVGARIKDAAYTEFIPQIAAFGVMPSQAEYYAELLKEEAKLGEIKAEASAIMVSTSGEEIAEAVGRINLLTATSREWQPVNLTAGIEAFIARHAEEKAPDFIKFGFPKLDKLLFLEKGDFIAVGGEPSAGKTALAAQMAVTLAKKRRVGFFSLETNTDKLMDRILSQASGIKLQNIKNNCLSAEEWKSLWKVKDELQSCQLEIIRASGMTVSDIQAYSLANRYEIVIVDYLQIIRGGNPRASRYETVTDISLQLHTMAQQNNIAVIALTQLSRPEKGQKNPTPPGMNDLRESGQIEQDADAVLILYYEDMKKKSGPRVLKVAKNKEGRRGTVTLDFEGETQTFSEQEAERAIPAKTATHYQNGEPIKHRPSRDINELRQFKQVSFTEIEEGGENPFL